MKFLNILILPLSLVLTQCASVESKQFLEKKYKTHLKKRTKETKSYNGWYNKYQIHFALLDSPTQNLKNDWESLQFKWSDDIKNSKKAKLQEKLAKQTEAFMSFYVPDPKNNNLQKKKHSLWKIFLYVDNQRFEGEVKKIRQPQDEVTTYFPFHTFWGTPYLVSFPVPTDLIDKTKGQVVITGPLGTAEFEFSPTMDK